MRHPDERHELQISLALDGELTGTELLELLDAMERSSDCRSFYRRARAMDRRIDALSSPRSDSLGPAIPHRGYRPRGSSASKGPWAAAAAIVLVALGLGLFPSAPSQENGHPIGVGADAPAITALQVQLGENEGEMSDERFLDLTMELLGADRRYQRKMFEVLGQVQESIIIDESGSARLMAAANLRVSDRRVADRVNARQRPEQFSSGQAY